MWYNFWSGWYSTIIGMMLFLCVALKTGVGLAKHKPAIPVHPDLAAVTQRVILLTQINDNYISRFGKCKTEAALASLYTNYVEDFDETLNAQKFTDLDDVIPPKARARQSIKSGAGSVNIQAGGSIYNSGAIISTLPYDAFNPQSEGWTTQRAVKDGFITYQEGGFNTTPQLMTAKGLVELGLAPNKIDPKGASCTHAGSAPCHFHRKHIG